MNKINRYYIVCLSHSSQCSLSQFVFVRVMPGGPGSVYVCVCTRKRERERAGLFTTKIDANARYNNTGRFSFMPMPTATPKIHVSTDLSAQSLPCIVPEKYMHSERKREREHPSIASLSIWYSSTKTPEQKPNSH